jgi:BirA family biotin operon repressor/biotin-[acetyl-CoA-carboxylase] ligase
MTFVLDISAISSALGDAARRFDIDLVAECASTNSVLMARAETGAAGAPGGTVLVCEHQSAGRGRRGRAWVSAPGDSLTFSLLWRFPKGTSPAGLSLVAGLAVVRALARTQTSAQLKWPNDILLDDRKLGGILVELVPGAPHSAVIGIGLNLRLPVAMPDDVRATAAALPNEVAPNELLADVLKELLDVLERFSAGGFSTLRDEWLAVHAFQDAPVRLLSDFDPPREGICRGVDDDGALLFESGGMVSRVLSGEVSLRSVQ